MMTMRIGVICVAIAICAHCRVAQADDTNSVIPKIVIAGLDTYKKDGADAAMKVWLKGSPLEGQKDALSEAASFKKIESLLGAYKSFELYEIREVTQSVKIVYLVLKYEKGPLYANFELYKTDEGWILERFDMKTEIEKVMPWLLFRGGGK